MRCGVGRVADVEVIRSANEAAEWFTLSLSPDDSAKVWSDERRSFGWTIAVSDHSAATTLSLGKLMAAGRDVLVSVESYNSSLGQMGEKAYSELAPPLKKRGPARPTTTGSGLRPSPKVNIETIPANARGCLTRGYSPRGIRSR